MAKEMRRSFLQELARRYGPLRKLDRTQSLFEVGENAARIYVRYSKVHEERNRTFYGLREEDLRQLSGHNSLICFLWDSQDEPLFVPFSDYEEVFRSVPAARDGQYKVQVYRRDGITELYVARAGRFNVEADYGWNKLEEAVDCTKVRDMPQLSHSQVQTLLGAIGWISGYDVSVPPNDTGRLDWSLSTRFTIREPENLLLGPIKGVLQEVDVVWIVRGSNDLVNLFEVEHSTPIYSGLLRFNDIHLSLPNTRAAFNIVANDERRASFLKQLNRPTFCASGMADHCSFLDYADVYGWHARINAKRQEASG